MTEFTIGKEYPHTSLLEFVGRKQKPAWVLWDLESPDASSLRPAVVTERRWRTPIKG